MNVAVLTGSDASSFAKSNGFEVFPIIHGKSNDIIQTVKLLRYWKPDIVHFQYPTMGYRKWKALHLFLPIVIWFMRIPIIMTWHEPIADNRFKLLKIIIFATFALLIRGLIYVRPNYLDALPLWFAGVIRKKFHKLIPNASTIPTIILSKDRKAAIRENIGVGDSRLVVYFGFAYPNKNIEQVFEVADPNRDFVVLISDLDPSYPYHKKIMDIAGSDKWKSKVNVTGFLSASKAAEILAAADAVVLPLEDGGGVWNTSVHAVMDQGTFLVTTSFEKHGFYQEDNVYYAKPNDVVDMRHALNTYYGRKMKKTLDISQDRWRIIANEHAEFYRLSVESK